MKLVRNFCIIAHIDHGKSTMADRFLEITGTIEKNKLREQMLDSMDLEREHGITIKLQPVHMGYVYQNQSYELNLIDTPGHVDFGYEVSRSLQAVEGAILLVDASQGIQAQTLANLSSAQKAGLTIIPVVNKIDLPNAESERVAFELAELLNCEPDSVIFASAKTGQGVTQILDRVIQDVPAPKGFETSPLQILIFDSQFNTYRGVIAQVRVVEGGIKAGDRAIMMANRQPFVVEEVGMMTPDLQRKDALSAGDIGYIVTGFKQVADCRVGDTITTAADGATSPLPGYRQPQPMVYASLYSAEGETNRLRTALEKLSLHDAALTYEPHTSDAFGAGFRVGFLGMLHLEITKERLDREYNVDPIVSTPVVAFHGNSLDGWEEPWAEVEVITPPAYIGSIMELVKRHRGMYVNMRHIGDPPAGGQTNSTAIIEYQIPLAELILNFHDQLKSMTQGYASLSYEVSGYRASNLVELTILIGGEKASPFSQLIHVSQVETRARIMVERLKELIPKQMFEVTIQAAVGGRIVARENVPAMRKDVTAKLYGGDVTRKRKLLEKQKEGKRKMRQFGQVELPTSVFLEALKPTAN